MTDLTDHVATTVSEWAVLRPDLDLAGMTVFGRVSRLSRLADLHRQDVYERHGLQMGDVDVLAPLWRHRDGLRPLDLRRSMMIGSGTLTPRLDRLEAAGLLERHPDPVDRRGRVLRLTTSGETLVPAMVEELLEVENGLLAALPASVRSRLSSDLGRLLASMESEEV